MFKSLTFFFLLENESHSEVLLFKLRVAEKLHLLDGNVSATAKEFYISRRVTESAEI